MDREKGEQGKQRWAGYKQAPSVISRRCLISSPTPRGPPVRLNWMACSLAPLLPKPSTTIWVWGLYTYHCTPCRQVGMQCGGEGLMTQAPR